MRIVLLTNILTPYRIYFYDLLYESFKKRNIKFHVLVMAQTEPDRNWMYDELQREYTTLLPSKTIRISKIYLHFNNNLRKQLRYLNPQLVICGGSYIHPSVLITILYKKIFKFQIIFWSESHLHEQKNHSRSIVIVRNKLRHWTYRSFDGFWYSGKLSLEFINKYCNHSKHRIFAPNIVDNSIYSLLPEKNEDRRKVCSSYDINPDNFIFICPSRLTKVKGIDKFIDLFKQAASKDNATIIIPGEGELKEYISQLINRNNLNIILPGFINQNKMAELYAISDCFLMPSLSDPNPLSCIEALWAGLPLLVSKHVGNYHEVIIEGENGYVFDYSEKELAISYIDMLITASEDWIDIAKNRSREIAKKIFDPKTAVERIVNESQEIILSPSSYIAPQH